MRLLSAALQLTPFVVATSAWAKPPIPVQVVFIEALSPRDTTSSETFRKEFESSVQLARSLTAKSMKKCGFEIKPTLHLFDANDQLQAFEQAKAAQESGTWLVVGPRRSNHYLLVVKGAPETPSVSIMASSSEVAKLAPLHLSLYPSNGVLATAAAQIALELGNRKTELSYFSVVSDDCHACTDFSEEFDRAAGRLGLKKLGQHKVVGESPDPAPVLASLAKVKPAFVLLPNYSKVSALLMGSIHSQMPEVKFIGGDGWGDHKFGFIERNPAVREAPGITVRGFPPAEIGLAAFPLGRRALKAGNKAGFVPTSGAGLAILRIFEGMEHLLCDGRPSTAAEFRSVFEKRGFKRFTAPWGVSAYRLRSGEIRYWKRLKLGSVR
jgi:hypothetical protein